MSVRNQTNCSRRKCVHFAGATEVEVDGEFGETSIVYFCEAFPDGEGIPTEILSGENLHRKPLEGQGNTVVYFKDEEED